MRDGQDAQCVELDVAAVWHVHDKFNRRDVLQVDVGQIGEVRELKGRSGACGQTIDRLRRPVAITVDQVDRDAHTGVSADDIHHEANATTVAEVSVSSRKPARPDTIPGNSRDAGIARTVRVQQ